VIDEFTFINPHMISCTTIEQQLLNGKKTFMLPMLATPNGRNEALDFCDGNKLQDGTKCNAILFSSPDNLPGLTSSPLKVMEYLYSELHIVKKRKHLQNVTTLIKSSLPYRQDELYNLLLSIRKYYPAIKIIVCV